MAGKLSVVGTSVLGIGRVSKVRTLLCGSRLNQPSQLKLKFCLSEISLTSMKRVVVYMNVMEQ